MYLITSVTSVQREPETKEADNPEIDELTKNVNPKQVLNTINQK